MQEYFPPGQVVQVDVSVNAVEYFPDGHALQNVLGYTVGFVYPSGQVLHVGKLGWSVNVPGAHGVHVIEPVVPV